MSDRQQPAVIFIEDDEALREAMRQALRLEGLTVDAYERAAPALKQLDADFGGVVVSDIRLPGMDGLEFFEAVQQIDPELPVIFTTGHGDVAMAVGAMKRGAADFLTKPYSPAALTQSIRRAAEVRGLILENRKLRDSLRDKTGTGLIGSSEQIRKLDSLVGEIARTEIDIVLSGPAGSGKTFLARRIHDLGSRQSRPFVAIDAGIWTHPDAELIVFGRDPSERLSRSGLVERAQGGTLLLDNIETVPEGLRGRVGSLLQTRSYLALGAERQRTADVRIIAITDSDGDPARRELLRYLGGLTLTLPSLTERRDDLPEIFRHFVAGFEAELRTTAKPLSATELARLMQSEWPGNLRELRDFARNFVLGLSQHEAMPALPENAGSLSAMVLAFERSLLADALARADGRVEEVGRLLQVRRKTLYDKLARHELKPSDFRRV